MAINGDQRQCWLMPSQFYLLAIVTAIALMVITISETIPTHPLALIGSHNLTQILKGLKIVVMFSIEDVMDSLIITLSLVVYG